MSLDLTVLRLLKYRSRFEKLARAIPKRAMDQRTQIVLDDMGRWFREYPDAIALDHDSFTMSFKLWHSEVKDEAIAVYSQLFKQITDEDVPAEIEAGLMKRLAAAAAAYDTTELVTRWEAGEEFDLVTEMQNVLVTYDQTVVKNVKDPQVRDSIEDLLKEEENDTGLHWRLECINRHIKPLRAGDFVVVAARPDKGKTTFAASELTHMASQLDGLFPNENKSILWFNNEGPGKRIVTRSVQAALNMTIEELVEFSAQPSERGQKSKLRDMYQDALNGRAGALRIFDIHGYRNDEVEELIQRYNPALVLFDMIDNISFGGMGNNNGQRTDQLLEAMYQWARYMGVKHDCAVMAMSQISADGDGLQYPTLPMLKDSKTGKQGAADVIITIGTVNDPQLADMRYIGTTKNKRVRTGQRSSPMTSVRFDGDRGRYVEDIPS